MSYAPSKPYCSSHSNNTLTRDFSNAGNPNPPGSNLRAEWRLDIPKLCACTRSSVSVAQAHQLTRQKAVLSTLAVVSPRSKATGELLRNRLCLFLNLLSTSCQVLHHPYFLSVSYSFASFLRNWFSLWLISCFDDGLYTGMLQAKRG